MRRFATPSIRQPLMWTIAAAVAVWLAGCTPDSPVTGTQEVETEEAAAESESADGDGPETASTPATPAEAGMAFLAENGEREGVVTTPSGLQYEVLASGDGATPGPTDTVTTHYHGTFVDGRIFDSSVQRGVPASFPVDRVIKGWTEALQMMKVGDKWKIVCPPDLAYGEQGRSGIPPHSTLIFEVELLDVKTSG